MKLSNPELDRLAAEKVMGWPTFRIVPFEDGYASAPYPKLIENVKREWVLHKSADEWCGWSPTTDWRAAGEVVERMRALGWVVYIKIHTKGTSECIFLHKDFDDPDSPDGATWEDDFIPRAITVAALLAVQAVTGEQV